MAPLLPQDSIQAKKRAMFFILLIYKQVFGFSEAVTGSLNAWILPVGHCRGLELAAHSLDEPLRPSNPGSESVGGFGHSHGHDNPQKALSRLRHL